MTTILCPTCGSILSMPPGMTSSHFQCTKCGAVAALESVLNVPAGGPSVMDAIPPDVATPADDASWWIVSMLQRYAWHGVFVTSSLLVGASTPLLHRLIFPPPNQAAPGDSSLHAPNLGDRERGEDDPRFVSRSLADQELDEMDLQDRMLADRNRHDQPATLDGAAPGESQLGDRGLGDRRPTEAQSINESTDTSKPSGYRPRLVWIDRQELVMTTPEGNGSEIVIRLSE